MTPLAVVPEGARLVRVWSFGERMRKRHRRFNKPLRHTEDFDEQLGVGMWRPRSEHRAIKWRLKRIWRNIRKVVKK